MNEFMSRENGGKPADQTSRNDSEIVIEELIRTTAHLAAQLTMMQIRLRALATVAAESGQVDQQAVAREVRNLADSSTGDYLQENLGEFLSDVIEVKPLEAELRQFLYESGDR